MCSVDNRASPLSKCDFRQLVCHTFAVPIPLRLKDTNRRTESELFMKKSCFAANSNVFFMFKFLFSLSWLRFSHKLVKILSVCVCVWVLTEVEQIVTSARRDL